MTQQCRVVSCNPYHIDNVSIPMVASYLHTYGPIARVGNDSSGQLLHERFADDMRGGLWRLDSHVRISKYDDRLYDGGHRCAAIIVVGKSVEIGVQYMDGPKPWPKSTEFVSPRRALKFIFDSYSSWFTWLNNWDNWCKLDNENVA